ncbi:glycolipid transfer protein-like [Saccostrea echinata]|uniref:glycolipid transfer protein-like n=1 Tax=Saccostrea echinata TaxID=191078 RepID=UPI002A7F2E72|nr:glycolipid transfer protein-like [Saccostrea echinata]
MTFFSKDNVKHFEVPGDDGKINTLPLLEAARGVVEMVSAFGKAFTPVKSDINGNIEKLQKKYEMDKEKFITINAMLDDEMENKNTDLAKVGGLWLVRGLNFLRTFMQLLIKEYKGGSKEESMKQIITAAYEATLKKYHGFIVKKVFSGVSSFAPYRKDFLLKMALGKEGMEEQVVNDMEVYLETMSPLLDVMGQLYKDKGLDTDDKV